MVAIALLSVPAYMLDSAEQQSHPAWHAVAGTLAGRLGKDRAFALTLLVGISVLFVGFLVASAPPRRVASGQAAPQQLAADVAG